MSAQFETPPNIIFTTGLIDKSGNKYDTVIVNDQEWLIQNYRTTKYADGSSIPLIEDASTWAADTTGAMCYYNNAAYHADTYGALYNHYALDNAAGFVYLERDGVEETGWRIPTDEDPWNPLPTDSEQDFVKLKVYCGEAIAGKVLKEVGTAHWRTPNTGTDSVGFRLLPNGLQYDTGGFGFFPTRSLLWTSKAGGVNTTLGKFMYRRTDYNFDFFTTDYSDPKVGRAVRLVRDVIL